MDQEDTALHASLRAELERLRRQVAAIEVLLGADHDLPVVSEPTPARAPGRRGPGVSPAKLKAVREFMEANGPRVRQVDIGRQLGENSGSVSLALRALEAQGDVRDTGDVDNKAKVWEFIGEPRRPQRVTTIEPGVGLSEGRRV